MSGALRVQARPRDAARTATGSVLATCVPRTVVPGWYPAVRACLPLRPPPGYEPPGSSEVRPHAPAAAQLPRKCPELPALRTLTGRMPSVCCHLQGGTDNKTDQQAGEEETGDHLTRGPLPSQRSALWCGEADGLLQGHTHRRRRRNQGDRRCGAGGPEPCAVRGLSTEVRTDSRDCPLCRREGGTGFLAVVTARENQSPSRV